MSATSQARAGPAGTATAAAWPSGSAMAGTGAKDMTSEAAATVAARRTQRDRTDITGKVSRARTQSGF
jgi:hypothetical protein